MAVNSAAICFNCGENTHQSKFCDKPQKYTRCSRCDNVCFSQSSHKTWCDNSNFVSEIIQPVSANTTIGIVKLVKQCDVSFKSVRSVKLFYNGNDEDIDDTVFMQESEIRISRIPSDFIQLGMDWQAATARTILIAKKAANHQLTKLVKIVIGADHVRLNSYYSFKENGFVDFNANQKQNTNGHYDCCLLVVADGRFNVRLQWKNLRYYFQIVDATIRLIEANSVAN